MIKERAEELILERLENLDIMNISKQTGLSWEETEELLETLKEDIEKHLFSQKEQTTHFKQGGKTMKDKNTETLRLWWTEKENETFYPAGMEFFDERFGEYRLKIDIHLETIYYRSEVVIKSGRGRIRDKPTIVIDLWPYERPLILEVKEEYETR